MALDQMAFEGTEQDVQVAKEVFGLMVQQGALYAKNAPIRQSLSNLTTYFARQFEGKTADEVSQIIDTALTINGVVFHREESDGEVIYVTTKAGAYRPAVAQIDSTHRLKTRLYEPTESEIAGLKRRREEAKAAAEVVQEPEVVTEVAPEEVAAPEVVEAEAHVPEAVVEEKPAARRVPVVSIAPGVTADLTMDAETIAAIHGDEIAERLLAALKDDFRFVTFGDKWFIEDMVPRFSKGDLKRFKEHILEEGEPLPDTELVTLDLLKKPSDNDFDAYLFAVNYRLLREKKDFEFVGVFNDHLWSVSDLPPIGNQRKKPSEIGQELRHLSLPSLAEEPVQPELLQSDGQTQRLSHVLTFWDYENGFFPYDRAAMDFYPQPMVDEQRAIILRFESPQLYVAYLSEIRLPTNNRGGWITGLESYFEENLVPGAKLTITNTERYNYFLIDFGKAAAQQANLLQFDEKKQRFVFRPTTYNVEVDEAMLLSQDRFPRLANTKRLDEAERKKMDSVIAWAFQMTGEQVTQDGGPAFWSAVEDLLPVVNIEKPVSMGYLRQLLYSGNFTQFYPDPETDGAFFYKPAKS